MIKYCRVQYLFTFDSPGSGRERFELAFNVNSARIIDPPSITEIQKVSRASVPPAALSHSPRNPLDFPSKN